MHSYSRQTDIRIRFTESDTPNTTANYDSAHYHLNSNQAFDTQSETNSTSMDLSLNIGNATGEAFNSVIYLFLMPTIVQNILLLLVKIL